jgi:hypothetical protein
MNRVNSQLSPSPGATYHVTGEGESYSISLTKENFPIAFSYGEKQRQVTPGSRRRKPSSSISSSTSSSRIRMPSSASSSTSSSLYSVYSPTSGLSSSLPWSIPPDEINLGGSRDAQLTHPGYSGELEWHNEPLENNLNSGIGPSSFVAQHNYDQFTLMDQLVVSSTHGPTSSSISSGGQPIGYLPGFVYPESQQISHTASNDIYSQGYEDPSILVSDPNTPRFPDYLTFMNQLVVSSAHGPTSSSISSGGQPIGYLPGFVYPESQQIPHTASNDIYSQGYEDPSILVSDPNTPRFPDYLTLMNQLVVSSAHGPTSSSISSGGQPIGYLPGFVYPESQEISHTASNDMHGQQNFEIYSQGYEDPSILVSDPNTPRFPDYHYRE